MKPQEAVLNIRYDFPIWDYRVPTIFSQTEGWIPHTNRWFSELDTEKHIVSSVEPGGLIFSALMDEDEWERWLDHTKQIATKILGYQIGELETGEVTHEFEWIDDSLSIFEDYQQLEFSKDKQQAWELYGRDKPSLSELDEIELEKWLFRCPWHSCHDAIVAGFQFRSHPSTARFLYEQIAQQKIPEFDYKPISRKCTWALADIGTAEAKQYLQKLSESNDLLVREFAQKRLDNWEAEAGRKGRMINSPNVIPRERIKLKPYSEVEAALPSSGKHISAYQSEETITVYQAYKPAIARYAVAHQRFGGSDFSFRRMSWIKPNFLWMMYRSGWAGKNNQERILAIRLSKSHWEDILSEAVFSSFQKHLYHKMEDWKADLASSDVRLQWDPSHDPYGNKLERRAIQIGLRGQALAKFSDQLIRIEDITPFVQKQHIYVKHGQLQLLEIPNETLCIPTRQDFQL
ncbi:MAG: DUF4291 domain-containing protein [Bacteroidota bacterium]